MNNFEGFPVETSSVEAGSEIAERIKRILENDLFESTHIYGEMEKGYNGSIEGVLWENKKYKDNVAGENGVTSDGLCQLDAYARECIKSIENEGDDAQEEAKKAIEVLRKIKTEAEQGKPDVQKIDGILSGFISDRLKHFLTTMDQRTKKHEQTVKDRITEVSQEKGRPVPDFKLDFSSPELDQKGRIIKKIMNSEEGYKSRKLMDVVKRVEEIAFTKTDWWEDGRVVRFDNFKEPAME